MKHLRILSILFVAILLVSGCAGNKKWYHDWKKCAVAGAAVGATTGAIAAGDEGTYAAIGGVGGGLLGGLLCYLFAEPDSDGDGVPDSRDKCPDTPMGVKVDKDGCPIDSDGDGVPDYLDKCPDTPRGVKVDRNGCPLDSDGDGVPDYLDKCPNTPRGVEVDQHGCPLDSDGDGVPDYLDKCPNTPKGVKVDRNGCPLDSDGDGVPDYLDRCPNTPRGVRVDKHGCPLEEKIILQGIKFAFDSSRIREDSKSILDVAVVILKGKPNVKVRIEGHTCDIGTDRYNQGLSERRAMSTKKYLVENGIAADRLETVGKGERDPLVPNIDEAHRKKNRRIEFVILGQ